MVTRNDIQLWFINKLTNCPTWTVKCKIIISCRMKQGAIQEPCSAEQWNKAAWGVLLMLSVTYFESGTKIPWNIPGSEPQGTKHSSVAKGSV